MARPEFQRLFFIVTRLNIPKGLWKWVKLGTRHTDTILQFRNKLQHGVLRGYGVQNMQERSCSYCLALLQPPLHLVGQSEQHAPPLQVIVIGRGEQEPPLPSCVQLTSKWLHRVLNSESVPSKKNNSCCLAVQGHKHNRLHNSTKEMFQISSHIFSFSTVQSCFWVQILLIRHQNYISTHNVHTVYLKFFFLCA